MPLLAPAGTVITLFPSASSVPVNGSIEIVATVIENGSAPPPSTGTGGTPGTGSSTTTGAGTPVHNGTLVTFTSTLGRIEPSEARTQNGQVRVRFIASGESGTATITAFSGGASAKLENFPVGSAAADRVIVTATNQTLPASGGSTEVQARVETAGGAPIAGVPVTFSTDAGTISPTTAITDNQGVARSTLTSTAAATVTATAGSKNGTVRVGVATRSGLSVTASPQATTAGSPVTFTISTTPGQAVTNARISFGDGTTRNLGTIAGTRTETYAYSTAGNFTVNVTADNGEQTGTSVSVGSLPVTLTASPNPAAPNQPVNFTAGGVGNAQVREYRWTFGDGATAVTTGPQASHPYPQRGTYTARVEIIGINGGVIGTGQTSVTIQGL
ncbi:MAG TPA: PKD domain-containing protein [Vicinamibacterales bacterium]|nr:PKD domain-containing protein [Vicinamibacterales bacterium]